MQEQEFCLIQAPSGGALSLTNNGTITSTGTSAIIQISGLTGGLTLSGTGTIEASGTTTDPRVANLILTSTSTVTFTGSGGSLVSDNASIGVGANQAGTVQATSVDFQAPFTFTANGSNAGLNSSIGISALNNITVEAGQSQTFNGLNTKFTTTSTNSTININATNTYNLSSGLGFNANVSGGALSIAANVDVIAPNASVNILAPNVTINSGASVKASSVFIDPSFALTLTDSGTIEATGAVASPHVTNLDIVSASTMPLIMAGSGGAITSDNGSIGIGAITDGTVFSSSVDIQSPFTFTANGTSAGVSATMSIQALNSITMEASQSQTFSSSRLTVQTTAASSSINLNATNTYNMSSGGLVIFAANVSGGTITFANNTNVTATNSTLDVNAPNVNVNSGVLLKAGSINMAPSLALTLTDKGTIEATGTGAASTANISIVSASGTALVLGGTGGSITSDNQSINIGGNVSSSIDIQSPYTFTANTDGATINVVATNSVTLEANKVQTFSATGAGSSSNISTTANGGTIALNSGSEISASGAINVTAASGTVSFGDSSSLSASSNVAIGSSTLNLGNSVTVSATSSGTVSIAPNGGTTLAINLPVAATAASISTAGGTLTIGSSAATNVSFNVTSSNATGVLDLNAGTSNVHLTGSSSGSGTVQIGSGCDSCKSIYCWWQLVVDPVNFTNSGTLTSATPIVVTIDGGTFTNTRIDSIHRICYSKFNHSTRWQPKSNDYEWISQWYWVRI